MSITEDLRKWARDNTVQGEVLTTYPVQHSVHGTLETLLAIADRIEAELADMQAFCDRLREAAESREDETLFGVDYAALPLDADGEPIHVGDVMEFSEFEIEHPVTRTVGGIGQGTFFAWCGERGYQQHDPKRYRHHYPPTVEGILRDFGVDIAHALDADPDATVPEAIIAGYAKRLRIAGDDE